MICEISTSNDKRYIISKVTIQNYSNPVNEIEINAMWDTGSNKSWLCRGMAARINLEPIKKAT